SMNIATFRSTPPRFLMCPPQHFAVTYSINPWMDPAAWADRGDALHASAEAQWQGLHARLSESGAAIEMVLPHEGLPDLVFAANAICAGRIIVLSSCSAVLRGALEARGYAVIETPLTAFQRSGGSACCLTLRLDHVAQAQVAAPRMAAAR